MRVPAIAVVFGYYKHLIASWSSSRNSVDLIVSGLVSYGRSHMYSKHRLDHYQDYELLDVELWKI